MTEKATAREKIVAEIDKAQQSKANLEERRVAIDREIAKWDTHVGALMFALDAMGDAPKRGRPATNGAVAPVRKRKPKPALGSGLTDLNELPVG